MEQQVWKPRQVEAAREIALIGELCWSGSFDGFSYISEYECLTDLRLNLLPL